MLLRQPDVKNYIFGANTDGENYRARNVDPFIPRPQAYKDVSADKRRNLSSLFAFGKRSGEMEAYRQAHMTPAGTPGVVNIGVLDNDGNPQPFVSFNWNGRVIHTDSRGMVKYVEKDYFQNAISLENERVKYVTQMISLVVGQPAESVVALFGYDFYHALAGTADPNEIDKICNLYRSYLSMAGIDPQIANRKVTVFRNYAQAEASPEVMCNFGDNDPEWSKAFNKLALLIEYHPSAIIFDEGTLNPLDSSGHMRGDTGHSNAGEMNTRDKEMTDEVRRMDLDMKTSNPNRIRTR
ncbi:MAG: hypothetical protein KGQ60_10655 [Planctomycetes bacterium]|nr:hypothetical protein [Planctomycetota bacterium]